MNKNSILIKIVLFFNFILLKDDSHNEKRNQLIAYFIVLKTTLSFKKKNTILFINF